MKPELMRHYETVVRPALKERRGYANAMAIPRLKKIVINVGVKAGIDRDALQGTAAELAQITGQKPMETKARKSIANFHLRQGMVVGLKVTLRGVRMYAFLERLIHIGFPLVRDFRGLPRTSFDGRGAYSFGLKEQTIFPEINPDRVKAPQGMDVTLVTTARTDEETIDVLTLLGLPLAAAS